MSDSDTILKLVLNNIPQGVFWKDRNSVYLGCNHVICQALGLSGPEDLIGKSDFEFPSISRQQAESFVKIDRQVMESGQSQFAIIEPLDRYDGRTIWIETIKVPLRDSHGTVIGVLGTWQDVTERQQAEEALRRSEQRYRSLVTATAQMVWMSNARGSQLQVTPPLEEFTGLAGEQLKGSGWLRAVHPDDRGKAEAAWEAATTSGRSYECEFRMKRSDQQWRAIHSRGFPILDQNGLVLEWIGIGIDVTERSEAEHRIRKLNDELEQRVRERTSELEAANKELEAFSYSVSHDLRAPLRAIDGFSRIVLAEYSAEMPPEAKEYLQDIRTNTRVMGQLVDDLLTFSRLSRQPIRRLPIHPVDLVNSCLEELHSQIEGRNIDIRIGDLPDCWADPALLKQVWLNLLSNAIKYSSKRDVATIEIGCESSLESGERTYFIKDNGVGFDMRYVHKLFGVFQRLHRSEEYEGTGVGLAIVQRVIHRHGGRVRAEGDLNRGAAFYFTLPEQGTSQ
jgi:PAS domain S-box-containing protein